MWGLPPLSASLSGAIALKKLMQITQRQGVVMTCPDVFLLRAVVRGAGRRRNYGAPASSTGSTPAD